MSTTPSTCTPHRRLGGLAALALGASLLAVATPAQAVVPAPFGNCTQLNKVHPHGVGKVGARDQTSGTPVTTFTRSTKLYLKADRANGGLDRDNDGIACEKA